MAQFSLTQGAIAAISTRELNPNPEVEPLLQVIDIRQVSKPASSLRYRLLVSDGVHSQQAMLNIQYNELVTRGSLQIGSIVKLIQFVCSEVQERVIIILSNIEMVLDKYDIIGNPSPFYRAGSNNAPVTKAPLMPNQTMNQPAAGNYVGSNSGPRPNIVGGDTYGGSQATSSGPRVNLGGNSYGGSSVTNPGPRPNVGGSSYGGKTVMNSAHRANLSGNSYGGSVVPTFQHTEQASGNNNIRPPPSSHNQRPASVHNQRPVMYANRGPEAGVRFTPISRLNPYQGRWTIKARVTTKTDLRTYTNAKGNGQVFSFDLLDSEGGEIRVTCFNDVAGRFFDVIKQGGVYTISKGTLKPANSKFNHLRNEYEMSLDSASTVEPCIEDDETIPELQWHFRCISDIEGMSGGSVLDLIGVVTSVDRARSVTRKDQSTTLVRTFQMKDMSGKSVEITLWGNLCNVEGSELENLCVSGNSPVVALKSGRVNEFKGKSVGTIANSQLFINPDLAETRTLKEWFDGEGKNTPVVSLSRELNLNARKVVLSQIKDEKLGTSKDPDWITVSATLTYIKADSFFYAACPLENNGRQCNKKVTDNGDGKYQCENCHKVLDKCDYRYILQIQIQDHTGSTYATAFQETGVAIMGISAEELLNLKRDDEDKFTELVKNRVFTEFIFKLKVKEEMYMDETRVKLTVVKADELKFQTEKCFLFDSITKLDQGDSGSLPLRIPENTIPTATDGFPTVTRETPAPAIYDSGTTSNVTRDSGTYTSQVSPYGKNQNTGIVSTGSASYTQCNGCGGTGHSSVNCPSVIPAPKQSYGSRFGNNVGPGPSVGNVPPANGSGNVGPRFVNNASHGQSAGGVSSECFKCHQTGHLAKDCPASGNLAPAYGSGIVGARRYG